MLIPWIESVKTNKKLLVFNGATGKWVSVFAPALQSFNKLHLGLKAVQTKDKDTANVVVLTSTGTANFTYDKTEKSATFDGNKLHGYTMLFHREGLLEKAVVFLPSDPKIMAGFIHGKTVYENVNPNQMRVVAVHELIHACGLDNDEHDDDGVFQKGLVPMGNQIGSMMAKKGSKLMPPIYLSGVTKSKILQNWS